MLLQKSADERVLRLMNAGAGSEIALSIPIDASEVTNKGPARQWSYRASL